MFLPIPPQGPPSSDHHWLVWVYKGLTFLPKFWTILRAILAPELLWDPLRPHSVTCPSAHSFPHSQLLISGASLTVSIMQRSTRVSDMPSVAQSAPQKSEVPGAYALARRLLTPGLPVASITGSSGTTLFPPSAPLYVLFLMLGRPPLFYFM